MFSSSILEIFYPKLEFYFKLSAQIHLVLSSELNGKYNYADSTKKIEHKSNPKAWKRPYVKKIKLRGNYDETNI